MLTFKTTVTDEEVRKAVQEYTLNKMQDDLCIDLNEIEITSVKKSKNNFIVEGRQKKKKDTKTKFNKKDSKLTCASCDEYYEDCDCEDGPYCAGCEEPIAECTCGQ